MGPETTGRINITELSGAAAPYQLSILLMVETLVIIAQNTELSSAGVPFSFKFRVLETIS
jgi:hypothetical protein